MLAWETMKRNAEFEQSCLEQAKREVGIRDVHKVLARAQQIKEARSKGQDGGEKEV